MVRPINNLEAEALAAALTNTSVSRIADLLAADPSYRERAAASLAQEIVNSLQPRPDQDARQLGLPL